MFEIFLTFKNLNDLYKYLQVSNNKCKTNDISDDVYSKIILTAASVYIDTKIFIAFLENMDNVESNLVPTLYLKYYYISDINKKYIEIYDRECKSYDKFYYDSYVNSSSLNLHGLKFNIEKEEFENMKMEILEFKNAALKEFEHEYDKILNRLQMVVKI